MAYGGGGFDMMSSSQFAGGGFLANNGGNARGESAFGGGAGGGKGTGKKETLRAVTILHLQKETQNTEDDRFIVDGQELGTVTLVGRIMSSREEAQRSVFVINDGTGAIEVTQWINDNEPEPMGGRRNEWQVGRYMRVYGHLKSFNNRKTINAYALKRIDDYNEVTHHFIKCVFEQLHLTRGAPPQAGAPAGPSKAAGMGPTQVQGTYGAAGAYGTAPMQQTAPYGAPAPAAGGALNVNDEVGHLYTSHELGKRPNGMSVDEAHRLLQQMGRNYTMQQIMQAAEYLTNEGHLYSTTDDRTFKATSN